MTRKICIILGVIIGCHIFFTSLTFCQYMPHHGEKLKITAPNKGTVYSPGDKVTVKAVYLGSPSDINAVEFVTQDLHTYRDATPPYEFDFTINKEFVGTMVITAYAYIQPVPVKEIAEDAIEITVKTTEIPIDIETSPYGPFHLRVGEELPLSVEGIYQGGVRRDITFPELGTTYSSSDLSVFDISRYEGYYMLVKAKRAGEAKLRITNGITKIIDVYVKP